MQIAIYRITPFTDPDACLFRGAHYTPLVEYQSVIGAISELVGNKNAHRCRLLGTEAKVGMYPTHSVYND